MVSSSARNSSAMFSPSSFKHNAVRLHDGKPFKRLTHALADGAKRLACLCVETLGLQAGEPAVEQEFGQARDEAVAGRVMAGFNQLAVVV